MLFNARCRKLNILTNSLDFYFYYLSFLIQKVDCFRIMLYYFLKDRFPEQLDSFAFKEYCPDLDSNNCLNLIILYIESIIENENIAVCVPKPLPPSAD